MTRPGTIRVTAYRGEHGEPDKTKILHSRRGSYSFGTIRAAERYANNPNDDDVVVSPRVIKAELTINKPLVNDPEDTFIEFSDIEKAIGVDKAVHIAKILDSHIFGTDNWQRILTERTDNPDSVDDRALFNEWIKEDPSAFLAEIYIDTYKVLDEQEWVNWFKAEGFDGAVHSGNGVTAFEAEYKIFSDDQARVIRTIALTLESAMEPG